MSVVPLSGARFPSDAMNNCGSTAVRWRDSPKTPRDESRWLVPIKRKKEEEKEKKKKKKKRQAA